MSFLHTVASELYTRHQQQLHQLAVVFPNRRQAVFFKHYFAEIALPPAFIPQLLTIEELIQQSTIQTIADPLVQSFELYKAYKTICLNEGESELSIQDYEQFYSIGETLLKDFREIDAYLVNIDEICSVLYNIEAIEKAFDQLSDEQKEFLKNFWASITNKGRAQEVFLKLWRRLPSMYKLFHEQLNQLGLTTLGLSYRQLAEGDFTRNNFINNWKHIAFVGFNAFNKSEETVLKKWQDEGFASLWFDADNYYIKSKLQEAGTFLRRNLTTTKLKSELPLLEVIANSENPITISAVQGRIAQAKLVSDWMLQLPFNNTLGNAAILLADESLLLPVLQSLPESSKPVNVTMGYPMQQTSLFSFFTLFLNIQADLASNHYRTINYQWVRQWIDHPLCDWNETVRHDLLKNMRDNVMIQVPVKQLQKKSATGDLLVTRVSSTADVFNRLRQILQLFYQQENVQQDGLLQGAVAAAWQLMQTAEPLFAQLSPAPTLPFLLQILKKQLGGISMPFEGEPLQGIQIMGLLESRGLDFDNILLLGASEGTLPRLSPPQTFLPDGLRRAFGLPVPEHQDAIFAYTFYRLLHRCQNMHLVYNSLITDTSTGEPSRFVQQLAFETKIPFNWHKPGTVVKPAGSQVITIEKTPSILNFLNFYLPGGNQKSFSPSQLNSYLACRLQFFLKNIAGLQKPQEISEEVDAAQFGSIVHNLLETLYNLVKEKQGNWHITKESIEWMRHQIDVQIEPAFREVMMKAKEKTPMVLNGLQQVIKEVVIQYTRGFLQLDEQYAPFNVESLEIKMDEPFYINIQGIAKEVKITGFIDRVDEKNGVYRMVDYKTGADKTEFYNVAQLFEREGKKQNKAALQTLIYSWMFQQKFEERKNFEPALIPLRAVSKNGVATQLIMQETKENVAAAIIRNVLENVEERLRELLEEIFDPAVPFDQTAKLETCSYCDFKGICRRR